MSIKKDIKTQIKNNKQKERLTDRKLERKSAYTTIKFEIYTVAVKGVPKNQLKSNFS